MTPIYSDRQWQQITGIQDLLGDNKTKDYNTAGHNITSNCTVGPDGIRLV